ncbi:hypothetical protein TMP248_380007 [Tenacibaculum maritimum]|uniref:hypothetical protein n=1 Tax=Tenacibaculum maritimum TaxID=107401 RepID=UPI0012E5F3EB|nr:hypothetical protein [Tenacibaculum maritimum]CAA0227327.1 hypothetical protein TMP248_380007 [Tenacibaculum maritimum]CAA0240197.1 hypothetical protein NACSLCCMFF_580013 [Tenacibaculum maritimum]
MNLDSIKEIIKKENFRFQNQERFFNFFSTILLEKLVSNKINDRSNYINDGDRIVLDLIHKSSELNIKIKVDEYEIYVFIDDFGYSMFQISQQEKNSNQFYLDVIDFLKDSFEGNFNKELFYDKDRLVKEKFMWKKEKYPEAIYMPIKYLFLEKLGIKNYKLKKIINYPSFL